VDDGLVFCFCVETPHHHLQNKKEGGKTSQLVLNSRENISCVMFKASSPPGGQISGRVKIAARAFDIHRSIAQYLFFSIMHICCENQSFLPEFCF
jgi:hypothetical protein